MNKIRIRTRQQQQQHSYRISRGTIFCKKQIQSDMKMEMRVKTKTEFKLKMHAIPRDTGDLTGDISKPCIIPLENVEHLEDLKSRSTS